MTIFLAWRTRLFLDTLDERIVPDAMPSAPDHSHDVITYPDGHTSGAVVASFDLGGTSNNAYVLVGNPGGSSGFLSDPGTTNNSYTLSGSTTDPTLWNTGGGTGNNSYVAMSNSTSSPSGFLSDPGTSNNAYPNGPTTAPITTTDIPLADLNKERDRLKQQIADNNVAIAGHTAEITNNWDPAIKGAQDALADLRVESGKITERRAVIDAELARLGNAGILTGPLYDQQIAYRNANTAERIKNSDAENAAKADKNRYQLAKQDVVNEINRLTNVNVGLQKSLDAVNALIAKKQGA